MLPQHCSRQRSPASCSCPADRTTSRRRCTSNEMNKLGPHAWELSFSYGRALQAPSLKAWKGERATSRPDSTSCSTARGATARHATGATRRDGEPPRSAASADLRLFGRTASASSGSAGRSAAAAVAAAPCRVPVSRHRDPRPGCPSTRVRVRHRLLALRARTRSRPRRRRAAGTAPGRPHRLALVRHVDVVLLLVVLADSDRRPCTVLPSGNVRLRLPFASS